MSDDSAAPHNRRRSLLVLGAVVVLVLVIVVVFRIAGGGSDDVSGGEGGQGGASAVPTPPSSAPGRGSFVKSTVAADGSTSVQQWIRSSTQIRSLEVSVYDPEHPDGGGAQAEDVVVQSLDGGVLAKKASIGSDSVTLKLASAVPNLYLSYQIDGGDDAASQTVQGRMLATVLGMDVAYSGSSGNVQRLVTGPGAVSNVACLRINGSAQDAPKPCGGPTGDGGWLVSLRGIDRSDRLLAQLEADPSASPSASPSAQRPLRVGRQIC